MERLPESLKKAEHTAARLSVSCFVCFLDRLDLTEIISDTLSQEYTNLQSLVKCLGS